MKPDIEIRKASQADLEMLWNRNIAANPDDSRWPEWKQEYIGYNQTGKAVTFCTAIQNNPVGEGTLLLSSSCKAIHHRKELCNDFDTANINALRIQGQYEGQGHISRLVRKTEEYARSNGITRLTIGVEAKETRNLAIYLHWGFTEFVSYAIEDGELVLYYAKNLIQEFHKENNKEAG